MVYEILGNVPQGYVHKQRKVWSAGLVTAPSLVLKLYDMYVDGTPPHDIAFIRQSKEFLKKEIRQGKIEPYLGLGFVILSEDMLNVARWDTKYPVVIKNQIYGYGQGLLGAPDLDTAKPLDIRSEGAFCIWELGIVNHEKNAWKRYLKSKRSEADKMQYLDSVIEGPL
ncbi:MAG: hypothetical protein HYW23_00830 [Candidatus Aenigmarchaeota archaeon]|nr:hypothetical protein [Candidatus Aenigmarchaeota archaeon]